MTTIAPAAVEALVGLHVDAMKGADPLRPGPALVPCRPLLAVADRWRPDWLFVVRSTLLEALDAYRDQTPPPRYYAVKEPDEALGALRRLWGITRAPLPRTEEGKQPIGDRESVHEDTLRAWQSDVVQSGAACRAVSDAVLSAHDDRGDWPDGPLPSWSGPVADWPPHTGDDEDRTLLDRARRRLGLNALAEQDEVELRQVLRAAAFDRVHDRYFARPDATDHRRAMHAPVKAAGRERQLILTSRALFDHDPRHLDDPALPGRRRSIDPEVSVAIARAIQVTMWDLTSDREGNDLLLRRYVQQREGALDLVSDRTTTFATATPEQIVRLAPSAPRTAIAVAAAPAGSSRDAHDDAVLMVDLALKIARSSTGTERRTDARHYLDLRRRSPRELPPEDEVWYALADRCVALVLLRVHDDTLLGGLLELLAARPYRTDQATLYHHLDPRDKALAALQHRRMGSAAGLLLQAKQDLLHWSGDGSDASARAFAEVKHQLSLACVDLLRKMVEQWLRDGQFVPVSKAAPYEQKRTLIVKKMLEWLRHAGDALDLIDSDRFAPLSAVRYADPAMSWTNWRVQTRLTGLLVLLEAYTLDRSRLCGGAPTAPVSLAEIEAAYLEVITTTELGLGDLPLVTTLALWFSFVNGGVVPTADAGALAPRLESLTFLEDLSRTHRRVDVQKAREYLNRASAARLEAGLAPNPDLLMELPESGGAYRFLRDLPGSGFRAFRGGTVPLRAR